MLPVSVGKSHSQPEVEWLSRTSRLLVRTTGIHSDLRHSQVSFCLNFYCTITIIIEVHGTEEFSEYSFQYDC